MRLDGYIRVSRVGGREGEGYISPDVQREAIERYAQEVGGTIVAWADDQDYSGGTTDRPAFQRILERIRAGETDGLVVMRIDRFARSVADGAAIIRELSDAGKVFASCHERIDPRTPEGRFMLHSFLNNAELFLNQTKAQWWTAKSRAVARGVHIGPTPLGYRREKSMPLEPDPVYGPAISDLFTRAASGRHSDTELARWMQARAPRREGRRWQSSEVRRWLRTRVYLGEVRYGDLVNTAAHPALTDPGTWERCQREPGEQRRAPSPFLLRGLIRCAHCRYGMGGQSRGGANQSTPVYRCVNFCEQASVITATKVEGAVTAAVEAHLAGARLASVDQVDDLARLEREAEEAEVELAAFTADTAARRLLGDVDWLEGLRVRASERDARFAALAAARARQSVASVRDLEDLDTHDLRDLLAGLVRHVFVRRGRGDDRCHIVWSDDPRTIDVPGPHRSGPFEPIEW